MVLNAIAGTSVDLTELTPYTVHAIQEACILSLNTVEHIMWESQQIGHKWIQYFVIFKPGKNIYFLAYPPPTLIHLPHRFTSASKPVETVVSAISAPLFQPFCHQGNVFHQGGFYWTK
jgi:hypothetical protein